MRTFGAKLTIVIVVIIAGFAVAYVIFNNTDRVHISDIQNQASVTAHTNKTGSVIDPKKIYEVTDIIDGDTFKVMNGDRELTVRMLGINTPETVDPRKAPECYGKEASDETKELLKGGEVRLELNPNREKYDIYGRILAYVYLPSGLFVNEYLVRNGYAREYTVGSPYEYQKQFRSDEKYAETHNIGLWLHCK